MPEQQDVSGRPPSKFQNKWIEFSCQFGAPQSMYVKSSIPEFSTLLSRIGNLGTVKSYGVVAKWSHNCAHTFWSSRGLCVLTSSLACSSQAAPLPFQNRFTLPSLMWLPNCVGLRFWRPLTLLSAVWEAAEHPWTGKWIGKANPRVSSWKPNCLWSKSQ